MLMQVHYSIGKNLARVSSHHMGCVTIRKELDIPLGQADGRGMRDYA